MDRFSFKTPGNPNFIQLHLRVYKIDARELEKERRQFYILRCIDNIEFINAQTRISKSYKGMLISDIANDIQTNFLSSSFISIEPTKNLFHIIPPYWTPIKTLNFLASRANSQKYVGSNYVYYQTVDGFNFESIESLCDTYPPVQNYIFQTANVRKDIPEGYKPRTVDLDQIALESYKFANNLDTLENITNGMYTNRLIWHDIQRKQFGINDFDYPNSYPNFQHIEPNNVKGGLSYLWTSKSDFNTNVYGECKLYPIGLPGQENHVADWMQPRLSQMQQLQNIRLYVTIPGDSLRRVGDLVSVTLPSPEALVEDQLQLEDYLTDRYLVVGVRHTINKAKYVTHLELVKDSIFKAYP